MLKKRPRLVASVGVNDSDYEVSTYKKVNGKDVQILCPIYNRWKDMLRRCHSPNYHRDNSGIVCEEWRLFSTFKQWMEKQPWEGNCLDKDILVPGNKLYSPETCVFIPNKINTLIGKIDPKMNETGYLGVYVEKRGKALKYSAQISNRRDRFGVYLDAFSAHKVWQLEKANEIEKAIAWYAQQECFRTDVAEALTSRVWKLRLENSKNIKTEDI